MIFDEREKAINIADRLTIMPRRIIFRLLILIIVAKACLFLAVSNRQTGFFSEVTSETEKIDLVMSTTKALTTQPSSTAHNKENIFFDSYIILDDEKTTINGEGASYENNTLTITKGGSYNIKGSLTEGKIVVNSKDRKKKVTLVLSGVDITCSTKAPLLVENSYKEVVLFLEKDTVNTLSDGSVISSLKEEDAVSTIYSMSPLRIDGKGTLSIKANTGKGIYCKSLDIRNDTTVSITSLGDAIKAESDVGISGGTVNIISGGGATGESTEETAEDSEEKPDMFSETDLMPGDKAFDNSSDGIFSKNAVVVSGGKLSFTSTGNSISTENLIVSGGTLSLSSDRSGVSANTGVLISGGDINIINSSKGIKSQKINLSGGTVTIKSQSDSLSSPDSSSGYRMLMSGGYLNIDSNTAEDSRGDVLLTGGTFVSFTPGEFKTNFVASGGTLFLAGDESFTERITATGDIEVRSFNNKQKANQFFAIVEDGEDEAIIGFFGSKDFSSIAIATEEIDDDEKYNLYKGGRFHGRAKGDIYIDCDYDYGTLVGSLS